MNRTMRRIAGWMLALGWPLAAAAQDGITPTSVLIGQSAAFSGPAAQLGVHMRDGAKLWLDHVNAQGGIHGRTIQLRTRDDKYEANLAAENTRRFVNDDRVFALFAYVGTPTSQASLPIFTEARVPFVAPFTGAELLRQPFNRYVFNVRASYYDETEAIVDHLYRIGARRIAVFHQADSYGQAGLDGTTRALVKRPKVFLLDEPLAALDKKLRSETQFELRELQRKLGMTFIVVTHDQEEAMSMADRIAVMNRGSIVQVAPPRDVYEHPISRWIAEFIGEINLFEGVIDSTGPSGTWVDTPAAGRVHTPNEVPARKGDNAFVAVRPEKVLLAPFDSDPGAYNSASGTLVDVAYLGDTSVCRIKLDRGGFMRATITNARRRGGEPVAPGAHVALRWEPDSALVLVR